MKRSPRSPLPRRVWVCSLVGAGLIVLAMWTSEALVRERFWQVGIDALAVGTAFACLRWVLGNELARTERAQQQSRASQEQLASVLEGSNDGFWDWDIVSGEVACSRRCAEMLGYRADEMPTQASAWHQLIHPEDKARALETLQAHVEGTAPLYESEMRLRTKTGEWKWILDRGKVVLRDPAGKPLRAAGTRADITKRKRTEQALRESEEKYRTLISHLPQRLFVKDPQGVFVSASENFAADLRLPAEDVIGKTDYDLCPPELAEQYRRDDQEVMATGQIKEVEEPYQLHGETRWAHTIKVPYHDAEGRVIGVLGILSDVTERKLAERALHESEERARLLVETIPLLAWRCDAEGKVLECNRRWYEYTGQTPEEARGCGWFQTVHPDDVPHVEQRMRLAADGQHTYEAEYRVRRAADGSYRWHLARALPMRDAQGRTTHWFGCATDIHDQREAQAAQRASEERYRTLLEAVTDALFVHESNADGSPGRFVEVNGVACERLGYAREELLGLSLRDLSLRQPQGDTAWIGKQLQDGSTPQFERILVTKDGRQIPVEIHARLFTLQGRARLFAGPRHYRTQTGRAGPPRQRSRVDRRLADRPAGALEVRSAHRPNPRQ